MIKNDTISVYRHLQSNTGSTLDIKCTTIFENLHKIKSYIGRDEMCNLDPSNYKQGKFSSLDSSTQAFNMVTLNIPNGTAMHMHSSQLVPHNNLLACCCRIAFLASSHLWPHIKYFSETIKWWKINIKIYRHYPHTKLHVIFCSLWAKKKLVHKTNKILSHARTFQTIQSINNKHMLILDSDSVQQIAA